MIDNVRTMYYNLFMEFDYSKEKDALLIEKRGISFEDIIESIKEKGVLLDTRFLSDSDLFLD